MPKVTDAHRDARREEILQAALRAFATKGFARTSMAEIIEESGLSAGAIYTYFEGKQELFAAVARTLLERQVAALHARLAERGPFSPADIAEFMIAGIARTAPPPRLLVQFWADATVDPAIRAVVLGNLDVVSGALRTALRTWLATRPGARDDDIDREAGQLLPVVLGIVQGYVLQRALAEQFDDEAYIAGVRKALRP